MNLASLEVIAGFGLVAASIWYETQDVRRPGAAIAQDEAVKLFPGFGLAPGMFERKSDRLYRVNRDGRRIDLTQWSFDSESGEFIKRIKRVGQPDAVRPGSYQQRFGEYVGRRNRTLLFSSITAVVIAPFSAIMGAVAKEHRADPVECWPIFIMFAALVGSVIVVVMRPLTASRALNVGPEPLLRVLDSHGPESTIAPIDRGDPGLGEYRRDA